MTVRAMTIEESENIKNGITKKKIMRKIYQPGFSAHAFSGGKDHGTLDANDKKYTVKDLSVMWKMTEDGVRKMIRRNGIPVHRPGRRKLEILHSELIAFIRQSPSNLPGLVCT